MHVCVEPATSGCCADYTGVCVCRDGVGVTWVSKTAVLNLSLIPSGLMLNSKS